MKILSVILSVYMLVLSFLPCGDIEDCKVLTGKAMIVLAQTDHSAHQEDSEYCSPFCFCACCGMNIGYIFNIPSLAAEDQPSSPEQNPRVAYKNDSSLSDFYGNIWLPPKLV